MEGNSAISNISTGMNTLTGTAQAMLGRGKGGMGVTLGGNNCTPLDYFSLFIC